MNASLKSPLLPESPSSPQSPLTIEVYGLHYSAVGKGGRPIPILNGIDFVAHPGELVAVMGPNGGGKTTLLSVLCGRIAKGVEGTLFLNATRQVCPQSLRPQPSLSFRLRQSIAVK